MGRKAWPTNTQNQWLTANIPRFHEAQRVKKVRDFNQDIIAAFFQVFTLVIGLDADDDSERDEGIVLAPSLRKAREVRILSFLPY